MGRLMRFVRYRMGGQLSWGQLEGDSIHEVDGDVMNAPRRTGVMRQLSQVELVAPAELACVMRRRVFRASREEAIDAVWGYTCANDVTARDIQLIGGTYLNVVWSKAYPAFCPIGPWIVVDEINPDDVEVGCIVNGQVRQRERTSDFIFDMATQTAWISQIMPLEAGDAVLTGTPKGVGRLMPGDSVTIAISGIGELTNPIVQGP
jgi:2-keto-4-pentenoate hydratase/2-oxohepta-3-ene-1,7-dioic acid hydratase in catechol pathway